jgi:hypothetical protein
MSHEHLLAMTLSPVEPRPDFVRDLKAQLLERARATLKPAPKRAFVAPRWLWVVAGVGGLLSVLGMAALGVRRARAARLATPGPQPAQ